MANIKEAFTYASQNPNSDFAKNLGLMAGSGALDAEAQKYGIDLSPFKPAKQSPANAANPAEPTGNVKQDQGLLASEKNFGNSIADAAYSGTAATQVNKNQDQHSQDIAKLTTLSQEKKAKGEDTTHLDTVIKQLVNTDPSAYGAKLSDIVPSVDKTAKQIIGEGTGVLADLLVGAGGLGATAAGAAIAGSRAAQNNKDTKGIVTDALIGAVVGKVLDVGFAKASPYISAGIEKYGLPFYEKIAGYIPEAAQTGLKDLATKASEKLTLGSGEGGTKILNTVNDLADGTTVKKAATAVGGAVKDAAGKVSGAVEDIANSPIIKGLKQTGEDILQRIPNAKQKATEFATEQAARAERIAAATPEAADAIKKNVPETIINTVKGADQPTLKAYKDIIDLAEEPGKAKTIGVKTNPTKVGGELASQQYDIIDSKKKEVGTAIGDEVAKLSKGKKIDITPSLENSNNVLAHNGIKTVTDDAGKTSLDFTESQFTPAERTKIEQLYNLTTEGGTEATPRQIYNKNKMFGKLKREASFDGIGNIIVDTPDGGKSSLFDVFRDIYMGQLEEISPKILKLNGEYKKFSNLTDAIEGSLLKTPNIDLLKGADQAEFAKVNLRRIFGEAQSSPAYEYIADTMDKVSRGLGYKGATPKEVALFAQEMRKIYPDIIPKTGFTGSIKGILSGPDSIVSKVSEIGVPDLKDQQAALRKLIESFIKKLPKK